MVLVLVMHLHCLSGPKMPVTRRKEMPSDKTQIRDVISVIAANEYTLVAMDHTTSDIAVEFIVYFVERFFCVLFK